MSKNFSTYELKNKIAAIAIAFILMLSMSAAFTASSVANAQQTVPTHAFIVASPNPVGVNQQVFIDMWLIEINPTAYTGIRGSAAGTGTATTTAGVWSGYMVTVTAPDGTNTTLGPYVSSDIATVDITYTPTQVGTYTLTFNFPGALVNGTEEVSGVSHHVYAYYAASSATTTFTVQQAPLLFPAETPLPTSYWQTPINWQNQLWYSISGNWFASPQWNYPATYNPDDAAPESAHILWTKSISGPVAFGGQIGGTLYSANDLSNYYTGKSYETFFGPPVIINGVLFYNQPRGIAPNYGFYAVDLRTGQQLYWANDTNEQVIPAYGSGGFNTIPYYMSTTPSYGAGEYYTGITYGEVFSHHNPNEVGGIAYLWGIPAFGATTLSVYDATTGNWILNIGGYLGGTAVTGPNGELLIYTLNNGNGTTGWLAMWNSTLCMGSTFFNDVNPWDYRPLTGSTLPYSLGIQWNVTVPIYQAPNSLINQTQPAAIQYINDGVVLAITGASSVPQNYEMEAGYSATTGAFLWDQNRSVAQEPGETESLLLETQGCGNGVYVEFNKATMQFYGFSITTGQQVWGPTTPLTNGDSSYSNIFACGNDMFVANDEVGVVAYNLTTGALLWSWTAPPGGLAVAWPTLPMDGGDLTIAGGMVFVASGNTHGDQLYLGSQQFAINATTGQTVWNIDFFSVGAQGAAADGDFVNFNGYDNQIYCFGPGQTATTVTTAPVQNNLAQVLISGTVTDQSPGQTCLGIPAAGTPAISDASMSRWMEYLYEQQQEPLNATGVPVTLTYIDPNGNTYTLGTTTSDITGHYSYTFTPTIPGTYRIIATFGGSNSYYGSTAETVMAWNPPAATAAPTATPTSVATLYFVPAVIAIIVIIIVGFAVLAVLALRKRP